MGKIAIVTDSTADLPKEFVKTGNITVVPLKVNFQDKSYTEGVDITNKEFYEKLEQSEALPTTSQPSPADFIEKYNELISEGYDSIIGIHISDKMSGTRQSALIAGQELDDSLKNFRAFDSKQVSAGTAVIVAAAAESVAKGKSFEDVCMDIEAAIENARLFALVDTLKYLEKGGRIGKARAIVGSLLNIKPVLTTVDGEIVDKDKVRTRKKGFQMLVDLVREQKNVQNELRIAICHSQIPEEAQKLEETLCQELGVKVEFIAEIGSVVGTHIGPGALFISFC